MVRGMGGLTRPHLEPGLCLLCGVPAVFYDMEGNVIKREPESPVYTQSQLFNSLCRCLDVPKGGQLRKKWDFEKEPFPFCESCEELMGSLVDLYRQVEQMEKTIKTKGLKGISKFNPISKFDERTQLFRNTIGLFDKNHKPGTGQNTRPNIAESNTNVSVVTPRTRSSLPKPCDLTSPVVLLHDIHSSVRDKPCAVSSDYVTPDSDTSPPPSPCDDNDYGEDPSYVDPTNGLSDQDQDNSKSLKDKDSDIFKDSDDDCLEGPDKAEWSPSSKRQKKKPKQKIQAEGVQKLKPERVYNKIKSCPSCPKKFPSNKELQQHMRAQHGLEKIKCDLCPSEYISYSGLKHHKNMVHSIGKLEIFTCTICSKAFKSKCGFKSHMAVHSDDYNFSCEKCPYVTKRGRDLRIHLQANHDKKQNHVCSICSKGFFAKTTLKKHMAVHSKERMYICDMCPNTYKGLSSLCNHKLKVHSKEREDTFESAP